MSWAAPNFAQRSRGSGCPFFSSGSTFFGGRGFMDSARFGCAAGLDSELCATGGAEARGVDWTGAERGACSARGTGRRIGPSLPGPLPGEPPIGSGRSIGSMGRWVPGNGAGWRTVTVLVEGAGPGTGVATGGPPTVAGGDGPGRERAP